MILKVTDICCTDINDPNCCHSPNEIQIDRTKAQILFGFSGQDQTTTPELSGYEMPGKHCLVHLTLSLSTCLPEEIVELTHLQAAPTGS